MNTNISGAIGGIISLIMIGMFLGTPIALFIWTVNRIWPKQKVQIGAPNERPLQPH